MKKFLLAAGILSLAALCAYCAFRWYQEALPGKKLAAANAAQTELFAGIRPALTQQPGEDDLLAEAGAVNESVAAWLTIPGTHIDYPVAQAADNDFYLHHGFDGQYNQELGCPFLDHRCAGDFSGFNSIVYAHNMTEQRMFADIALYRDEAFMQAHPQGVLVTHDAVHPVEFFAYLNVPSNAPAYHAVFISPAEQEEYLDYIFSAAQYVSGISPEERPDAEGLHLLLLSTCTFEYPEARGILIGVIAPPQ